VPPTPPRLRVCVDADVLFAGSASTSGASHVVLQLGELGIIDVRPADQARAEAERNLADKLPSALPAFRTLCDACTSPIPMATQAAARRLSRAREADPKDAPILAAAIAADCRWLLTFNVRDYRTERIRVSQPGPFLEELRAMLLAQGS
jgi:predicted nucleic acid-binding protein